MHYDFAAHAKSSMPWLSGSMKITSVPRHNQMLLDEIQAGGENGPAIVQDKMS